MELDSSEQMIERIKAKLGDEWRLVDGLGTSTLLNATNGSLCIIFSQNFKDYSVYKDCRCLKRGTLDECIDYVLRRRG